MSMQVGGRACRLTNRPPLVFSRAHPNAHSPTTSNNPQGFKELAAISARANTKIVIPRGRNVNHLDMLLISYYTVRSLRAMFFSFTGSGPVVLFQASHVSTNPWSGYTSMDTYQPPPPSPKFTIPLSSPNPPPKKGAGGVPGAAVADADAGRAPLLPLPLPGHPRLLRRPLLRPGHVARRAKVRVTGFTGLCLRLCVYVCGCLHVCNA